jgi:aspartyl/asparaginyl beta-hydroxylase (cupin superfamily)
LTAEPFHDVGALHFAWLRYLEQNYSVIREELTNATLNPKLTALGNHIWVPAAREEAIAYGPDWKTLVLQDRCNWEETNCKIFPKTVQLVKNSGVPSVELFFAKQEPGTGIKPHTDNTNFILTSHLGLDVPEGQCWMQVGELKKNWLNGRGIIADTSFIHSTANESENRTRFVLIIRFWHPELLSNEKHALQFLFDAIEDPTPDGLENTIRRADVRENLELEGKNPSCANKLRAKGKGLGLLSKGMK